MSDSLPVMTAERQGNWIYDATTVPWNAEMLGKLRRYGYIPGSGDGEMILPWTALGQVRIALDDGTVKVEAADPDGFPFWRVMLKGDVSLWALMGTAHEALTCVRVKHRLRPAYSTTADHLAFAREWLISEEWV